MSPESTALIILIVLCIITVVFIIKRRIPKRVKRVYYTRKWREIQKLCINKECWPQAVLHADILLEDVLKKRRKDGKTMGERLVAAQKDLTNNDSVWQAHKLANHVRHNTMKKKLSENDVKSTLVAFRQALRDLGAL